MRWVSSAPRPFAGAFLGAMLLGALTAMMLITAPARADVVTVVSVTGKGLGLSSSGQETTTVKGKQMRRDATERGKSISYLYDLENRSLTVLNHSRKEAEVFSMAALAGEVRKRTKAEKLELKIEPTGATKTLLGKACQEYSVESSVPARAAGGDVLVRQTGTAWLATGGVGGAEYSAFWKATSGGDLFLVAKTFGGLGHLGADLGESAVDCFLFGVEPPR